MRTQGVSFSNKKVRESIMEYFEKVILTGRGKLVFGFQKLTIKNEYVYRVFTQYIIFIMRKNSSGKWDFQPTAFPFVPDWVSDVKNELEDAIENCDHL